MPLSATPNASAKTVINNDQFKCLHQCLKYSKIGKLVFKQNSKYMLICGYLNTVQNSFWGHGIWYFKYQILLNNSKNDGRWWLEVLDGT